MRDFLRALWIGALLLATTTLARHGVTRSTQHVHRRAILSTRAGSPLSSKTDTDYVFGVNVGGWLVLEKFFNGDMFENTDAKDQWTYDSRTDIDVGQKLRDHWDSWFTADHVAKIKKWGFNW
jgi:glucan 1,3-beta-glucosidase